MTALIANRYQPTGGMAAGGMGDIIECVDNNLSRRVVIKKLQAGQEGRRLLDEQKALLKLRSKHVVQMYDVVQLPSRGGPTPAIVLEYIEGTDLEPGSYPPDQVDYMRVLWQIACGIMDIHNAGVIHRDLKPNNIRLDAEGTIKILDFGLARDVGASARTIGLVGTPVFMAPELWGGSAVAFDQSIDVYAFGVTALALASSAVPLALRRQPPVRCPVGTVAGHCPTMPSHLAHLIEQCLAYDSDDRPTMDEVVSHLARHLLRDRHRALLSLPQNQIELHAGKRSVGVRLGAGCSLTIEYNGFEFVVKSVAGNVLINNIAASPGQILPNCCVIGFSEGSSRMVFAPFDVSNPEVLA